MDVKTAGRTLDLIEVFATEQRPLTLSELARAIHAPVSSCHALVRTLEHRGYVYSTSSRRAFYPTKRLLRNAERIAERDPLADALGSRLTDLAQKTGETVLLGKRVAGRIVFVEVHESSQGVRYSAEVGDAHPLHASAMGKAILSQMTPEEYEAALAQLAFSRVTAATLTNRAAFERDLRASVARGWFQNRGENETDILAVAVPIRIDDAAYAVAVAGPLSRVDPLLDRHIKALTALQRQLESGDEANRSPRREVRRRMAASPAA